MARARRLGDLVQGPVLEAADEALRLYRLYLEGRLRIRDPSPPRSWGEALARIDYSLWLYALLASSWLSALAAIAGAPLAARLAAASLLVFFLPGYAVVRLAYPRGGLRPIEEFALSIAASLSVVPLVGLILNYTVGLGLSSVAVSLASIASVAGIVAHYRGWSSGG